MRLFLDNDIILKLSSIGMLQKIEDIFSCLPSSIFTLASAKFYIGKSKLVRKAYSTETIESALDTIQNYNVILDEFLDENKSIELSQIQGIDSGEQILFSLNITDSDYLILTGDKNALRKLSIYHETISQSHKGKIICLEYLLLKLLNMISFDEIAQRITLSDFCSDSAIRFCFSQTNLTIDKAKEGLISYYNYLSSETGSLLLPL